MTTPRTRPAPTHVRTAGYALACALADDDLDLDLDTRLTLLEALRILTDVIPAYEPVTEPLVAMSPAEAVTRTRHALAPVVATSTDIGDLLRAARALQALAARPAAP